MIASQARHIVASRNRLGEGPVWVADEARLYWIDLLGDRLHSLDPVDGDLAVFPTPVQITALAPRSKGGFVCATADGFGFWDPHDGEFQAIPVEGVAGRPEIRFNDGAVDVKGRFWAGTMNQAKPDSRDGELFRFDGVGPPRKMASGFTICNGIGWSPDHKIMYFTDTLAYRIVAFDFNAETGSISTPRPFVRVPPEAGCPDGLAVDVDGHVWSANWGGFNVRRYDPAGKLSFEIRLPAENVTSCAFGGADLDSLFITTAWEGLTAERRVAQPLAGDLFVAQTVSKGLPSRRFQG